MSIKRNFPVQSSYDNTSNKRHSPEKRRPAKRKSPEKRRPASKSIVGFPQAQQLFMSSGLELKDNSYNECNIKTENHGKRVADKIKKSLHAINRDIAMWAAFFAGSLLVFFLFSSADISFLLTLGSLARAFGFGVLSRKTFKTQEANGVSIKTLQLYCFIFICRLVSIVRHDGYLPYDKSGDWLYHVLEFISLVFTASALYKCVQKTNDTNIDSFGELRVPSGFGAVYLALPCLILALVIHPTLNGNFLSDVTWTFAMYLESVALMPQLYMFQKQAKEGVELITAHFVFALGFGRVLEFVFWTKTYHVFGVGSGSSMVGYLTMLSQATQLVLMLDFFWFYCKAIKNSTPLILPSHSGQELV